MTVDLCTKSCKEIGQPLAALNYGTVGHHILVYTASADILVFLWSQVEWRCTTIIPLLRSTLCWKYCSAMRRVARAI